MVVPKMSEVFFSLPIISDHPSIPTGSCAEAGSLCHQLRVALGCQLLLDLCLRCSPLLTYTRSTGSHGSRAHSSPTDAFPSLGPIVIYAAIHGTDTSVLMAMLSPCVFVLPPPFSRTTVTSGLKVLSLILCAVGTAPSTTGPARIPRSYK